MAINILDFEIKKIMKNNGYLLWTSTSDWALLNRVMELRTTLTGTEGLD
jgi:hypothetical protein